MTRDRYFVYGDEEGLHIISWDEIIIGYFPHWKAMMVKAGKGYLLDLDECVKDFLMVHWGWEIKKDFGSSADSDAQ